jgi:DNA-binding transcriptional LysR family regulator
MPPFIYFSMKEFTFHQMKVFVAVVEQGTFKKAADALDLTQPAITLHMQNLESVLGFKLLNKSGRRGSEITIQGKFFYYKSLEVLSIVNQIRPGLAGLTNKLDCIKASTL